MKRRIVRLKPDAPIVGCDERGAAIVEFAVALPLMIVVLIGIIDFARVSYTAMAVSNAARAGVLYGSQSNARAVDTAGIQNAAMMSAQNDIGPITATATNFCEC